MAAAPPLPHPLPSELIELIADRFRVLSEPLRLRLLDCLMEGEATVSELQQTLGSSQQNVSKHLGTLYRAGLVTRDKRGTSVHYAVGDESVFALCELVCGGLRRHHSALGQALDGR